MLKRIIISVMVKGDENDFYPADHTSDLYSHCHIQPDLISAILQQMHMWAGPDRKLEGN